MQSGFLGNSASAMEGIRRPGTAFAALPFNCGHTESRQPGRAGPRTCIGREAVDVLPPGPSSFDLRAWLRLPRLLKSRGMMFPAIWAILSMTAAMPSIGLDTTAGASGATAGATGIPVAAGGAASSLPIGVAIAAIAGAIIYVLMKRAEFRNTIDAQAESFADSMARERGSMAQLRKERDDAVATSHTRSELLAMLSREVRAHMDGIVGSANLLLDTKMQPSQRMQLITLRASGESLLYVLGDVQAICDLETGSMKLNVKPLDLRSEFAQVIEVLSPRAALKGVELCLVIAPEVPRRVVADGVFLRQFFFNLGASALQYAKSGCLVLRVERAAAESIGNLPAHTRLRFGASAMGGARNDSGTAAGDGAPPAEPGMELAVTKRLVEIMGGGFGITEGADDTTDFWFELPLDAEPDKNSFVPFSVELPYYVVVLDDAPAARVAADGLLNDLKIDHEVATSAEEAVEGLRLALEDHSEAILFLDETLPESEVSQLAQSFSGSNLPASVRVVLMSLRPDKAVLELGFAVSALLQKPLLAHREIQQAIESARRTPVLRRTNEQSLSKSPFPGSKSPFPAEEQPGAKRVLLVEDNEVSRQVTGTMLKRLGCKVDIALDGLEAIRAAAGNSYDLILMDIRMPNLNGWDAARQIAAASGKKTPPIVAVTAEVSNVDRERATEAGMCDFVSKPVNKSELIRVLDRWAGTKLQPPGGDE